MLNEDGPPRELSASRVAKEKLPWVAMLPQPRKARTDSPKFRARERLIRSIEPLAAALCAAHPQQVIALPEATSWPILRRGRCRLALHSGHVDL
jgi:hypothetical protein